MKNKTLGIVGGGQLGRMLTQAAQKLNIKTIILDPTPQSPAGQIADRQIIGDFKNAKKIEQLAEQSDYVTFEIESANAQTLNDLKKKGIKVEPNPKTLEIIQDKFLQKKFLKNNNIPVAQFAEVKSTRDIEEAANKFKYPFLLKAKFHAYDGRGNAVVKNKKDIKGALEKLKNQELYVEKFVPFKKELAIQVARTSDGKIKTFPLVETLQKNNICHLVKVPALVNKSVHKNASTLAKKVMKILKGTGVFGIEMFLTSDNKVLINEIAPRVHNSGHYTIEACKTSQFEQHVRVVCHMPLGSTDLKSKAAVMINILGKRDGEANPRGIEKARAMDGVFVHVYGKKETRKERKMGHITALGSSVADALTKAESARRMIHI